MNIMFKQNGVYIAASINVGLLENRRLV